MKRGRSRGWFGWACVATATPFLAAASAWLAAPMDWRIDLVANFSAQAALLTIAPAIAFLLLKQWRALGVVGVAFLLYAGALVPGRAERSDAPASLRVLVFNPLNSNATPEAAIDAVLAADADVVVLVETPPEMVHATWAGGRLHEAYPWVVHRGSTPEQRISHRALMCRWPIRRTDGRALDDPVEGVTSVIAETPAGPVGLVATHPFSPRTPVRWRGGLEECRQAGRAAKALADRGLPVVVLGDLNSTPSGLYSRTIRAPARLGRAKPLGIARGTYPASWRWPLVVSLDDALVSPGVAVRSWRPLPSAGSDHAPVLIELVIPRRAGS